MRYEIPYGLRVELEKAQKTHSLIMQEIYKYKERLVKNSEELRQLPYQIAQAQ